MRSDLIKASKEYIESRRDLATMTEMIPENVRIFVVGTEEQDVDLIVPSGAFLFAEGAVVLRDAELIVEEDGSVEFDNELSFEIRNSDTCGAVLNGDMINYGTITIGE